MKLLLLALLLAQDSHTIPKAHKRDYSNAATDCRKAEKLIQSDPNEAVRILTTILDDNKIEKRECRLRIEFRPGTYSKWYEFFPYHFRALAYLELAGKAPNLKAGIDLLEKAEKDFSESVSRNLASSKKGLADVREHLQKLRNELLAEEKEPAFRREWKTLVDEGRFAAAKAHVESKGTFLSSEKRKQLLSDTGSKCREALVSATNAFTRALRDHPSPADLSDLRVPEFNRRFRLPAKENLVETSPEYDWSLSVRATLVLIRGGKEDLPSLCNHAISAIALGNQLIAIEPLAWSVARDQIAAITDKSRNAPAKDRETLRQKAQGLQKIWQEFGAKVQKSPMRGKLPARDFTPLLKRFPVDWKGVPAMETAIENGLQSKNPVETLATIGKTLRKKKKVWNNLTIESRRQIVGLEITVGALRRLAALESMETSVEELKPLGQEWKDLGGSVPPARFGPRVEEVFRKLLR